MTSSEPNARDSPQYLQDSRDFDPGAPGSRNSSWRSSFSFTSRNHLPHLLFSILISILSSTLRPIQGIICGRVFAVLTQFGSGSLNPQDTVQQVASWCLALVILGITSWFVEFLFMSSWLAFGELQAKYIRQQLFTNMLEKDMSWYEKQQTGIQSLLTRIETQIRELQLALSQPLGFCIYEISLSLISLGVGFYLSWTLTLVMFGTLPILGIVLFVLSTRLRPAIESEKAELTIASKYANTAFTNLDTVNTYNGQDQEIWQYQNAVKKVASSYAIQARSNALQFGFFKCITVGLFIQGFWFGLLLVNKGMDPARVYTTFYVCLVAMQSIEVVLPQWMIIAKGQSAGYHLSTIMKTSENNSGLKLRPMSGAIIPEVCKGDIDFKNVTFSYPSNPDQAILKAVSFYFPAKETTYVVGQSGSGKSTIGNLLLKYYNISQGEILIDGHAIQTLSDDWIRDNITLVQQQSVLFNETVFQNIAFGKRSSATGDEVLAAAHTADLEQTLLELPNSLDTMIGASGKSFSGGQQQRIVLARARLRNSTIVILDEATSGLDQKSRDIVIDRIREWRTGKTTIIITHDISRILDDEYVYVLENGVLVQEGHRKCLAEKKDGTFASLLPPDDLVVPSITKQPRSPEVSIAESYLPDFEDLYADRGFMSKVLGQQDNQAPSTPLQDGVNSFLSVSVARGGIKGSARLSLQSFISPEVPRKSTFETISRSPRPPQYRSPQIRDTEFENRALQRTSKDLDAIQNGAPRHNTVKMTHLTPKLALSLPKFPPTRQSAMLSRDEQSHRSLEDMPESGLGIALDPSNEDVEVRTPLLMGTNGIFTTTSVDPRPRSIENEFSTIYSEFDFPLQVHSSDSKQLGTSFELQDQSLQGTNSTAENLQFQYQQAASMTQILRTLWPMLRRRDRVILVLGLLASFVIGVATPAFAYVFAQLLNVYHLPTDRAVTAKKWALILIVIAIIDGFATFCSHLALEHAAQQWVNALRVEALKRILAQPRSWFEKEKNSPSRLSECLDRNAGEMRNLVGRFVGPIFVTSVLMSVTVVWALLISWKLTLVTMVCGPVVYLITCVSSYVCRLWEDRCNEAASTASSIFTETFSDVRVVRAFTLEAHFQAKCDKAIQAAWRIGIRRCAYTGITFAMLDLLFLFLTAIIFRYASVAITSNGLSLLSMIQVINLLLFGISNAVALLAIMPQISSTRATASQMLYLSHLPLYPSPETEGTKRIPSPFPVIFKNCSYTYPSRANHEKALENINLRVKAGTFTAIVGASGSGKSTLASLLLGLYIPDPGPTDDHPSLTFANTSISELNISSLRNFICLVAQQPILFPTSIYANITYGLPEGSPYFNLSAATRAAQEVGIHEFISSLPSGYFTVVGDGGMGVSGGQAQRIAIARALIRQPKLLILDEPTSALDGVSAEAIRQCLKRIMETNRGRTRADRTSVVVITHDVEMMRVLEKVVLIEKGRVVMEGSFEELGTWGRRFRVLIGLDR